MNGRRANSPARLDLCTPFHTEKRWPGMLGPDPLPGLVNFLESLCKYITLFVCLKDRWSDLDGIWYANGLKPCKGQKGLNSSHRIVEINSSETKLRATAIIKPSSIKVPQTPCVRMVSVWFFRSWTSTAFCCHRAPCSYFQSTLHLPARRISTIGGQLFHTELKCYSWFIIIFVSGLSCLELTFF